MKKLIYILLMIPLLAYGQSENGPSIQKAAKKLTGIWILKAYEHDSLHRIYQQGKENIIAKTIIKGKLVKTETKDGFSAMELSFDESGKGNYQDYSNYSLNSETFEIISTPPVPRLKIKNGELIIFMTYLLDEQEEKVIELTEDRLILKNEHGIQTTYSKIK